LETRRGRIWDRGKKRQKSGDVSKLRKRGSAASLTWDLGHINQLKKGVGDAHSGLGDCNTWDCSKKGGAGSGETPQQKKGGTPGVHQNNLLNTVRTANITKKKKLARTHARQQLDALRFTQAQAPGRWKVRRVVRPGHTRKTDAKLTTTR